MKKKYIKGQYEYATYSKKYETIKTIIMFALSFGVYFIGIQIAGSNRNYLTILAVLGLLPASKSLVLMIMALKVKVTPPDFKDSIEKHIGNLYGMFHLVFTSENKNYSINHLIVTQNSVIGYSNDTKFDANAFNKHMDKHLKMDAINDIVIKIFTDKDQYLRRLDELNKSESNLNANEKVLSLIYNITV